MILKNIIPFSFLAGPISTSPSNTNALSPKIIQEPNPNSPNADQHNSSSSSANSSFNLERSQSLRISKKSLRSLSSKGMKKKLAGKKYYGVRGPKSLFFFLQTISVSVYSKTKYYYYQRYYFKINIPFFMLQNYFQIQIFYFTFYFY